MSGHGVTFFRGNRRRPSLRLVQQAPLWGNEITDVQPLAGLMNLQWIQLGDNEIADVSPLASLTNLQ